MGLLDVLGGKKTTIASGVVIVCVMLLVWYYFKTESFSTPDGVVARRSQRQTRSDTEVDRTWNLKELEKSVALINRQTKGD